MIITLVEEGKKLVKWKKEPTERTDVEKRWRYVVQLGNNVKIPDVQPRNSGSDSGWHLSILHEVHLNFFKQV